METECEEPVSTKINGALRLRMCMQELQDISVQRIENVEEYSKIKEVVMNLVDNRRSQHMPSSMTIGQNDFGHESHYFLWGSD